jgi:glucosamine-6-phosphate deaminase
LIWETLDSYEELSTRAATMLLDAVRRNPKIVLGLPTGRTPIGMYSSVVRDCPRKCFHDVTTFNLDEYVGIPRTHPHSYYTFMRQHLFDHIDIDAARTHIPNGTAPDLDAECAEYDNAITRAGHLGLTFLGLGRNGHIGFNEPGSSFSARTRVVELTESTRQANASLFDSGHVPTHALTMGIATILDSKEIVLLAAGAGKIEAINRLRSGEISEDFPASALWKHPNVRVLVETK